MFVEMLKNIIPVSVNILALALMYVAKLINGIATLVLTVSMTLHKQFGTTTGKKLTEIENASKAIVDMYTELLKKAKTQKEFISEEDNKLAKILKSDKNSIKLVKNEDTTTNADS